MSKKNDEKLLNKYKQAKIDLEVIELENFHLKQDIVDLKRVVLIKPMRLNDCVDLRK